MTVVFPLERLEVAEFITTAMGDGLDVVDFPAVAGRLPVVGPAHECRAGIGPLTESQLARIVRTVSAPDAVGLIEANQKLHTLLAHGLSVEHHFGDLRGQQGRDIQLIDYAHPERNEFAIARQFSVRGARRRVVADIAVFINGLPVTIIECKSPHLADPIGEAVRQFDRYQEASGDFLGQGAPSLFHTVQILIATCGTKARCGTVHTPARFFTAWKDAWPLTEGELCTLTERENTEDVTEQELLLCGMLWPKTLLKLVRTFVAFETEHGRTVKKLARYQQFRAVGRALQRILAAETPGQRGGVIWHTQGSGKSLTMLWLAVELRREARLGNPLLVVITDRIDLDQQIADTFAHCGFPNPERAESGADLRKLLGGGNGRTVLTTIQKFLDRDIKAPAYTAADNVFVLVDEAHRTQYGQLAAMMRAALPGACFLGFTGTPIDKRDRSTPRVFGSVFEKYRIQEAEADGATVPILYEPRMAELHVEGQSIDKLFDRTFASYEINVRAEENPVLYRSLRERLEEIIRLAKEERLKAVEQLRRLRGVAKDLRTASQTATDLGFTDDRAYAFYRLLDEPTATQHVVEEEQAPYGDEPSLSEQRRVLAEDILLTLESLAVIDWTQKDDVQRVMRRKIKEKLREAGYALDELEPLTMKLMELARARLGK